LPITDFPVVISGAGPAGSTASMFLSEAAIPHLLLEKDQFPRDKICGDAISGKGLDVLAKIKKDELIAFGNSSDRNLLTYGMRFVAPNGREVNIPFPKPKNDLPVGFLSRRMEFDHWLFENTKSQYAETWQNATLEKVTRIGDSLELEIKKGEESMRVHTNLILGADGSRSIVKKNLQGFEQDDKHFCGGIRAYYNNVSGLHNENYLELHFLKDLLPGYFWIFPLPGGKAANVGMGMLSAHIKKNKVNLRKEMLRIIEHHPAFAERFQDAAPEGKISGWGLPLGSKKRAVSGNNFLLLGDAGSFIDPFTGEGIGNAIISGLVASRVAVKAIQKSDYSENFLAAYDSEMYLKLWNELKLSYTLQKLSTKPWLFNFVVNRLHNNTAMRDIFTNMFYDLNLRAQMQNPLFYFKLLFSRS
jgi:geranylgeranyl reductase family protein